MLTTGPVTNGPIAYADGGMMPWCAMECQPESGARPDHDETAAWDLS
jgi:hypothetical protein